MIHSRLRPLLAAFAILGALAFVAADADARSGKGGSAGSRGSRTYSAPPPTATAPTTAAPINRTMTQPSAATTRTAAPAGAAPAQGGFFKRPGFLGGLAAGLLGAGLIGMLFGQGLFGNLAGFASILGFIVQLALIGGVAWLLLRWWQRRSQPAPAYAGGPTPRQAYDEPQRGEPQQRTMLGNLLGGGMAGSQTGGTRTPDEIGIEGEDFDAFERLLGEIQTAYGREDLGALRARVTPEMLSYFSEELADNASRGVVNEISDVKLLQGDLSESWREDNTEYATVAMRFELKERFVERASGKVVEGDGEKPIEVTELWTFMRARGGNWLLSAIQQVE